MMAFKVEKSRFQRFGISDAPELKSIFEVVI
jgi:hypothetical protein